MSRLRSLLPVRVGGNTPTRARQTVKTTGDASEPVDVEEVRRGAGAGAARRRARRAGPTAAEAGARDLRATSSARSRCPPGLGPYVPHLVQRRRCPTQRAVRPWPCTRRRGSGSLLVAHAGRPARWRAFSACSASCTSARAATKKAQCAHTPAADWHLGQPASPLAV